MFYAIVLVLAVFHLFALSQTARPEAADENTKVLIYLSVAVALSVPLLGMLGHARGVTVSLLAAAVLTYLFRNKIADFIKIPLRRWISLYERQRPYPCLIVSFSGLFSWAWYHP